MQAISVSELRQRLEQNSNLPVLLDVREPWEFALCRIEGAKLVPMRDIPHTLDGLEPSEEMVVICHHGIRSRQVCMYLERNGFTNVINLDGGMHAWATQIDPEMQTY